MGPRILFVKYEQLRGSQFDFQRGGHGSWGRIKLAKFFFFF